MDKKDQISTPAGEFDHLEKQRNWDGLPMVKYGGFWQLEMFLRPILSAQKHFEAKNNDVILATMPKAGTTWLKALTYSIANRKHHAIDESPLLTSNPHKLIPMIEFDLYMKQEDPDLEAIASPRIFNTHMPYTVLPDSVRESECRIIYVCRNPLDLFISNRAFLLKNRMVEGSAPLELDEAFDMFCNGVHGSGPVWDHMLEYWKVHLENPKKVLFLKYEDLKEDVLGCVRKIGEFMGCPFSPEEEEQGRVEEISKLCSFESLKNLEVNKTGSVLDGKLKNSTFFRKGEVGDWKNYLSPAMAEWFRKVIETKLEGSGLVFEI